MRAITSAAGVNLRHVAVLRFLSGVLSASSAGLALAERIGVSTDEARLGEALQSVEDWNATYPSQSESAALLDAALDRARESGGLAAF